MKVLSKHCFLILKIINKLGIKNDLKKLLTMISNNETELNKCYLKLREGIKKDTFTAEETAKLLVKKPLIAERIEQLQNEKIEGGLELAFLFVENLANAEEEIYSLVSEIKGIELTYVKEEMTAEEFLNSVKEIILSKDFINFFTSILK